MTAYSAQKSRETIAVTDLPSLTATSGPLHLPGLPYAAASDSNSSDSLRASSQTPTRPPLPVSRRSRRSIAAIARERTSTALANLASITAGSTPSLHSTTSSSSLTRQTKLLGIGAVENSNTPGGTPDEIEKTQNPLEFSSALRTSTQNSPQDLEFVAAPEYQSAPSTPRRYPFHSTQNSLDRSSTPPPQYSPPGSYNKMHQTSSRLLRMTDEERPFTRDFKDLFSTLIVSLPLSAHRIRLTKYEQTFTSEEAINNLGSLKFSQSNRMPDPKDPSRIVTTTTTTTFSMAKEMARSVCQRFVDARFIESVEGKLSVQFPLKGALWQLTPKGTHILYRFCQRNGINSPHIAPVLQKDQMHLVILERDTATDKLSQDRSTIEVIFRRFAGQDGPNIKSSTNNSDSDSLSDYNTGMVGVKMAKERKIFDKIVQNSFTGKAATDWLMDCCTTIDRRETYHIASLFVTSGLMWAVVEDKVYMHQNPESTHFQPTKNSIYALTDKGQRICGWISRDKSDSSTEKPSRAADVRGVPRDSNNNRLNSILQDAALRLLFREFLRQSLCEENLSFYVDVTEFTAAYHHAEKTKTLNKPDAVRETLAAAYGLYNAFLAPGSPCELNIDHSLRNSLASRMTRAVGDEDSMLKSLQEVVDLFELAQTSVFKLMSSDSVPKFMKEPRYTSILREHNFDLGLPTRSYSPTPVVPERSKSRSAR